MIHEEEIEILYNTTFCTWGITDKVKELYKFKNGNVELLEDRIHYDLSYRTDPILIEIYKELGDGFDDTYHKTKLKKIPKKYENYYDIDEENGREYVTIDYTKYKLDTLYNEIKSIIESPDSNHGKINEIEKFIKGFIPGV